MNSETQSYWPFALRLQALEGGLGDAGWIGVGLQD
jgi:hypothetical protein